jgi:hypothetical protein
MGLLEEAAIEGAVTYTERALREGRAARSRAGRGERARHLALAVTALEDARNRLRNALEEQG